MRRVFRPSWLNLAALVRGEDAGLLERTEAKAWSLALESRRVPHRLRQQGRGWVLETPAWYADKAAREIGLFLDENPGRPQDPHPPRDLPGPRRSDAPTWAAMTGLILFFAFVSRPWPGLGLYPQHWLDLGQVRALLLLEGQWWRAATALTLHADAAHVAANAVVGGVFAGLLCRELGSGLGWFLILASGVLGNVGNALIQSPEHGSIGFSTAVFGAAGILSGLRAAGRGLDFRGFAVPVAAGLGLLAMLGTAGENTDLGAHLLGFAAGLALGLAAGLGLGRLGAPSRGLDLSLGLLALGLLPAAWAWAWLA
jgi:membrane associated rhomboid family serine protease